MVKTNLSINFNKIYLFFFFIFKKLIFFSQFNFYNPITIHKKILNENYNKVSKINLFNVILTFSMNSL